MLFPKKKKKVICKETFDFDFCTENRVLFFEENWNLKVKAEVYPFTKYVFNMYFYT